MIVNLLTEHHLEFLSLIGGFRGSSESTLVKMSNCWKSHATAQFFLVILETVKILNYNPYSIACHAYVRLCFRCAHLWYKNHYLCAG